MNDIRGEISDISADTETLLRDLYGPTMDLTDVSARTETLTASVAAGEESVRGVLSLSAYLTGWGVVYLIVTLAVWLLKKERFHAHPSKLASLSANTHSDPNITGCDAGSHSLIS